ncbi:MAG TPA: hypothetical protein VK633_15340, partial [Verrucomicrobiae bacterium]|nr:hypothetical protein [Verrucomicrobiae bacterium]
MPNTQKTEFHRVRTAGLAGLFFLSGAAGLGYQVVWAKAFGAGIGHEFAAVLAVVSAFMSGMAAGAFLFGKVPERWRYDARAYGILELLAGLWGGASVLFIPKLNSLVIQMLGIDPPFWRHWLCVFGTVLAALFPATAAMGATLPALERLVFRLRGQSVTGLLYGVNTLGAMVGALGAAFWLIRYLGIGRTLWAFAALNIVCGCLALALSRSCRSAFVPLKETGGPKRELSLGVRLFCTGFLGIGFETVVIRALSQILESTVYTFAVVLAIYLAGAAAGAAAYYKFKNGRTIEEAHLFQGLALSCFLSGLVLRWMPAAYQHLRTAWGDSLWAVALAEGGTTMIVFLPPSFFMGATFTALAEASLQRQPTLSWSVALNSLGGAAGPAVFGLLLIPFLGLKLSWAAVVLGYLAFSGPSKRWLLPTGALLSLLLTPSTELIQRQEQKLVHFRDGVLGSVAVLESANGARVLKVNNRFQ